MESGKDVLKDILPFVPSSNTDLKDVPEDIMEKIAMIINRTTDDIVALRDSPVENIKGFVNSLVSEVLSLTMDYAQSYCVKMEQEYMRLYRSLFLQINTGIGFTDLKTGRIIDANPYMRTMLEIEEDDIIGHNFREFFDKFIINKEQFEEGKKLFKEQGGTIDSFELLFRTKSGKEKWFLVSSRRIKELDQESFSMADITAIKELQAMRDYTNLILAHDIRSPLTGAMGFAGVLEIGDCDEELTKKCLQNITKSLKKIEEIIQDHLDIMKLEKGTCKLNIGSIELRSFCEMIHEKFNFIFKDKGVKAGFSKDIEGQSYIMTGDMKWLEHMYDNLIKNALEEASKNGGTDVTVEITDECDNYIISIRNPGHIPPEIALKLFKSRYVKSSKTNGNGIGSYFIGTIARSHGGDVWIGESSPEKGTAISVRLPKIYKEKPLLG